MFPDDYAMASNVQPVDDFCAITGVADRMLAENLLEACGGNLEMAVNMHMEDGGGGGGAGPATPPAAGK